MPERDPIELGVCVHNAVVTALLAFSPAVPRGVPAVAASRHAVPRMDLFAGLKQGIAKAMAGNYDAAEVKSGLERQIKQKPAIMYATSTCPFCAKAKKEITATGSILTVIDFDDEENGNAMRAELMMITGQSSVPQVFIGGEFIGGCNDGGMGGVMPLKQSGKLEELLIKAGALVPGARI